MFWQDHTYSTLKNNDTINNTLTLTKLDIISINFVLWICIFHVQGVSDIIFLSKEDYRKNVVI